MKEALLKKRYGIPAALLLVLVISGTALTALAWYTFVTISSETTVQEPLSTTETKEFSETMYPGQTNTWTFVIENSADVTYQVKADMTYSAPSGISITKFFAGISNKTSDLKDDGSATFSIPARGTISCIMTITAAKDATPGNVSVSLSLSRG